MTALIMTSRRLGLILSGVYLFVMLSGCKDTAARASTNGPAKPGDPAPYATLPAPLSEVFDATIPFPVPVPGSGLVTIETDLQAENIEVITYPPPNEVVVDCVTYGAGKTEEIAAVEAHEHVTVTVKNDGYGGVVVKASLLPPNHNPKDRIRLHIRVPDGSRLKIDARQGGNITASGEIGAIEATTSSGAIRVTGATGAMKLITSNGDIQVDNRESTLNQKLELYAVNGNITVFSVGASVTADTTVGNIRFIGSLFGTDNSFTTTGGGKVMVALPNDLPHHFAVESGGRVTTDFMSTMVVCDLTPNASNSLKSGPSSDSMGKIITSDPVVTPTHSISVTMGAYQGGFYLKFQTTYREVSSSIPGGNLVRAWWSPECDQVQRQEEPNAVNFRIRTERGDVAIRLIRKHP